MTKEESEHQVMDGANHTNAVDSFRSILAWQESLKKPNQNLIDRLDGFIESVEKD